MSELTESRSDDDDGESSSENTYLTFRLATEEFAVSVSQVTEIVRLQKTFAVPDVPPCVRGVINLRGKVIPLLDMRARFRLPDRPYSERTVLVVLENGESPTGLVIDDVTDVIELLPADVESLGVSDAKAGMVSGVARVGDRMIFLVDTSVLLDITNWLQAAARAA